jgi:ElaB/YqjD/DUF883 family membrane-anchored ribosome-binding protein
LATEFKLLPDNILEEKEMSGQKDMMAKDFNAKAEKLESPILKSSDASVELDNKQNQDFEMKKSAKGLKVVQDQDVRLPAQDNLSESAFEAEIEHDSALQSAIARNPIRSVALAAAAGVFLHFLLSSDQKTQA